MPILFSALTGNSFIAGGLLVAALGAALTALKLASRHVTELISRTLVVSLEFREHDVITAADLWLTARYPGFRSRIVSLESPQGDCDQQMVLRPGFGPFFLRYEGRWVLVWRWKEDEKQGKAVRLTIMALGRDPAAFRSMLREIEEARVRFRMTHWLYVLDRYEEWKGMVRRGARPLSSVILRAGQVESLTEDAKRFLSRREWYRERGIPWRRSYMLAGPPGTGKTSVIEALAAELGLPLYVLNLGDSRLCDSSLMACLARIPASSAVVIEDIDCVAPGRKRTESISESSLTLSGLLNALDGTLASEGRLLFVTTNHPENLDPALTRHGRVDQRFDLGLADRDMAMRMFLRFHPGRERLALRFGAAIPEETVSPADLQGLLLDHEDAEAAVREAERRGGARMEIAS